MTMRMTFGSLCLGWAIAVSGTSIAAPGNVTPPSADIDAFVRDYGLRESATPVSERPGWRKPRAIIVDSGVPGLLEALQATRPDLRFLGAKSAAEMVQSLNGGADVIIGRSVLICDDAVLAAAHELRWLHSVYAGVERCTAKSALTERRILLTNMRAVAGSVIAEHALAMLLALTRHLDVFIARQAAHRWEQDDVTVAAMTALHGKTLLVVGLGGIGTEVAKRADAFGMRVIATRATAQARPSFVQYVGTPQELPKLLADADVIVNAAPLTPATRGLFNAELFSHAKPGAIFINVGRGGTVVTADLLGALISHRLAGAGLDVVDPEPLPKDDALWSAPNLILTPHVAGTAAGLDAMLLRLAKENLRRYTAGERMLSEVDIARGY